MNILLVSWYFPPVNDVAALRTGALADFLTRRGHDVFVLTAARRGNDESLAIPLPPEQVVRTDWFDIDHLRVERAVRRNTVIASSRVQAKPIGAAPILQRARDFANRLYTDVLHVPDRQVGWLHYAIAAGRKLMECHKIDLIYASGPSFVAFLVANSLNRKFGTPWIAEYRDGWSGDLYKQRSGWRDNIDRLLESRTVRSAAGVVAVSEPWADDFRTRFAKPTAAIYNGFDIEAVVADPSPVPRPNAPISIVYFGQLYDGLRDPTPLYQAIKRSGLTPRDVEVVFYGPDDKHVRPLAEKLSVSAFASVKPRVTHAQSLQIQRASDVLLLLQAPGDPRNVPAKIFEYFASGRPILGLGLDQGVPARMIRDRRAGLYVTNPDEIAVQLKDWVQEKRRSGCVAAIPEAARAGLSRDEQFASLEAFLERAMARTETPR